MERFDLIRQWAEQKGIIEKGNVKTQYIKLQEESGELAKAILEEDLDELKDAVGDMVVVLTSLSSLSGFKIEDAIDLAYAEIKNRKGEMINNTFKKENK
jgi:NTP pyrophosphatase (non-canonical NTP hydrolase)|tara:strand:- start:486 stop:782 length:297 start_codon:yes stop_codon:yes gene_type:complete